MLGLLLSEAAFVLFVGIAAVTDLRKREIPNSIPIILLLVGTIRICISGLSLNLFLDSLMGLLIGGLPLLIAAMMKGGVGGGDVKLVACGGFYLGFADSFGVLFFSLISMLIVSVIFIRIKKLPRKTSLPYAPFYEAACILLCLARFFA